VDKPCDKGQDRVCTCQRNIGARYCNQRCCEKAIRITYCECVSVALFIQYAKIVRHIMLSVAWLALPYFSTLSHKRHAFRGKVFETCVLIFSTISVQNISHSNKNWARQYQKCTHVFMYCNRYYFQVLMKCEFSRQIPENASNIKFHENPSSGSQIFRCGRTDRQDEVNSGYSYNKATRCTNFSNLFLE